MQKHLLKEGIRKTLDYCLNKIYFASVMISLIIPVYNEAENIMPLVKKIKNSLKKYKYEVIFINDGSYDDTEEYLKKND